MTTTTIVIVFAVVYLGMILGGLPFFQLDPVPYLLGLACAANVGSALTLIGNPQNMLIGESLRLSFGGYLREAAVPVLLGLVD